MGNQVQITGLTLTSALRPIVGPPSYERKTQGQNLQCATGVLSTPLTPYAELAQTVERQAFNL